MVQKDFLKDLDVLFLFISMNSAIKITLISLISFETIFSQHFKNRVCSY